MEDTVSELLELARLDELPRARAARRRSPRSTSTSSCSTRPCREHRVLVDTTRVSAGRVHGRREQLARVVRNLLDNADRHARTMVAVELVTTTTTGTVELTVDDDGPGIPVEDRERVFERFTRLDDGRARDAGGLGLGLSMVKAIAEQHGGTVTIDDAPLGGARITRDASRRPETDYRRPRCRASRIASFNAHAGLQPAPQRRVRAVRPRRACCAASTPT